MDTEAIRNILLQSKALQEGHYKLKNGYHTNKFIQCAYLTRAPQLTESVSLELAALCRDSGAELVLSPALGGIIFGYEVSKALQLPFLYTERKNGAMTLRRGFAIPKDTPVLIIEDVVTTGSSVWEVIEIVRAMGGKTVMIGSIVNKTNGSVDFGVPFASLLTCEPYQWPQDECPLCKGRIAITKPMGPMGD